MLTLRQRIFAIVGMVIGLAIAAILLYFLFRNKQPSSVETGVISNTQQTGQVDTNPTPIGGGQTSPGQLGAQQFSEDTYLNQLSRIFVERFASFSNQEDNQHVDEAMSLATDSMKTWIEKQLLSPSRTYEGTTTAVLSTYVIEKKDDVASVEVGVQQTISKEQTDKPGVVTTEIQQKTGRVELAKINNEWKVNALYWE
jgi:hypothetical protein